jgi:ATP-dependent Zn protease
MTRVTCGELLDRLHVLRRVRVAEELVFGDISTRAQDDLHDAVLACPGGTGARG